ncbi:MAG TPA: phosphoribosylanthranilate isomerase [Pyrinomonadaceae bacterium]|nr:phosphoribosylanthranilate isomerase [Pyrinomonadaceae bacterium]
MVLIKICGITNLADAEAAVAAGARALGFNFYRRSPRYLEPEAARRIIERLPKSVLSVGVFVNEAEPAQVAQMADAAGVEALQLHGDESPDYCAALAGRTVIKALRVGAQFQPETAMRYAAHAILLDAYSPQAYGGTGLVCDWSVARRTRELVPRMFLAGGLTPENVGAAVATVNPYAVDVCGGIEAGPGRKDLSKLRAFIAAVQTAATSAQAAGADDLRASDGSAMTDGKLT